MLKDNESIASYKLSNVIVWMTMAFQGGFLNIGGFMACHRYVSHVTGYGTTVPYEFAKDGLYESLLMALVPISFLLGAMVSGFLVDVRLKLHKKPRYYISFGLIFSILALITVSGNLGYFGIFGEPLFGLRDYVLLVLLTFVCGVQNGTVTTVSKAVIRTTHLSGITTDLGIGLARFIFKKRIGEEVENEGRSNLMRIGIIGFFIIGSFSGYIAFSKFEFNGFIFPLTTSSLLLFVMLYNSFIKRKL